MQAKLLTEEPHFYVPLPNPNLIHHLPSQMYILSYILYLFFFFFVKLKNWESSLIPFSIMHPKSLYPLSL